MASCQRLLCSMRGSCRKLKRFTGGLLGVVHAMETAINLQVWPSSRRSVRSLAAAQLAANPTCVEGLVLGCAARAGVRAVVSAARDLVVLQHARVGLEAGQHGQVHLPRYMSHVTIATDVPEQAATELLVEATFVNIQVLKPSQG